MNVQKNKLKHNKAHDQHPKAPTRRRSQPSSQNSCKSYDLHNQSPLPTRPTKRRTYSQSSCKIISSNITSPTPISNHQAQNYFKYIGPHPTEKADCKVSKNENMLKPQLPNPRSSIRKKINESADPGHTENVQNKDKPNSQEKSSISTIAANDSIKLYTPIDMKVSNALIDKKWENAMKNSSLDMNKIVDKSVQETHLGHTN